MFVRPGFIKSPGGSGGGISSAFQWVVADQATRDALVVTARDLNKLLWQSDVSTAYVLTSVTPVTWEPILDTKLARGPAFRAIRSATTAITAGGTRKIPFDLTLYDSNGSFNGTDFVVPPGWDGLYHFDAALNTSTNIGSTQVTPSIQAYRGATRVGFAGGDNTIGGGNYGWAVACDFDLIAGDVVTFYAFIGSGTSPVANASGNTFFSGHYIGQLRLGNNVPSENFAFSAALAANQVIPSSPDTKIAFTLEDYDNNSCFDTVDSRFIAPAPGIYTFKLNPRTTAAVSGNHSYTLRKNGVAVRTLFQNSTAGLQQFSAAADLKLVTGDYVEAYVNLNAGASVTLDASTRFMGYRTINGENPDAVGVDTGPAFSAYASVNQSKTVVGDIRVFFGTELYDTHGTFDTSSSLFTVPVGWDGVYHFDAAVGLTAYPGGAVTIGIGFVTVESGVGKIAEAGVLTYGGGQRWVASADIALAAGDTICVTITAPIISPSTDIKGDRANTHFSGHFVRALT